MSARRNQSSPTASTTHEETDTMSARRTAKRIASALLSMIAALAASASIAAPASAAPELDAAVEPEPITGVTAGGRVKYTVSVSNTGDEETNAPLTVDVQAPAGLEIEKFGDPGGRQVEKLLQQFGFNFPSPMWECTIAPDRQSGSCTGLDTTGIVGEIFELPFSSFPIFPGESGCEFIEVPCPLEVFLDRKSVV